MLDSKVFEEDRQRGEGWMSADVFNARLAGSDEVGKLVDSIKEGIQTLLARYGGL